MAETGCLCYLPLADDEEGVSSGTLSDDVLAIFIMSLNTHKGESEDSKCGSDRKNMEGESVPHLLHDVGQFTEGFLWKTLEGGNTAEKQFHSFFVFLL